MSGKDYSEASFHDFMRQSVMSGLINPSTGRARNRAAEQLLVELKAHERQDLRLLDVEDLCNRFHKLQDSTVRPETLDLYKSRLSDALADFIAWTDSPDAFTPRDSEYRATRDLLKSEPPELSLAREELALKPPRSPHEIFPIPLREDLVVYVQNVPLDMTLKEAEKICAVVRALADPEVGES